MRTGLDVGGTLYVMSDADWWLCECQSLNNLSARRCYSCRKRRPKTPVRASEHLGYRAVVSWDGKVRMEERRPDLVVPVVPQRPPPIREPVMRSILDVAPPPPEGARITYWTGDPALDPRRPAPAPAPAPQAPTPSAWFTASAMSAAPPGPEAPPSFGIQGPASAAPPGTTALPPPPVGATPTQPRPAVPVPVVASPLLPLRPGVVVPIGDGPADDSAEIPPPSWPHWRELLDGPRPDAARLRQSPEATAQRLRARLAGPDLSEWRRAAAGSSQLGPTGQAAFDPSPAADPAPTPAAPVFWPAEPTPWPAVDMAARRPDPSAT
jgi:hypothetical protein